MKAETLNKRIKQAKARVEWTIKYCPKFRQRMAKAQLEKLEAMEPTQAQTSPKTKEFVLVVGKNQYKTWLAKINGKRDRKFGGYQKEFIEPTNREFDLGGEVSATYHVEIELGQIYQDSEGDFWQFKNLQGDVTIMSFQEVAYIFKKRQQETN